MSNFSILFDQFFHQFLRLDHWLIFSSSSINFSINFSIIFNQYLHGGGLICNFHQFTVVLLKACNLFAYQKRPWQKLIKEAPNYYNNSKTMTANSELYSPGDSPRIFQTLLLDVLLCILGFILINYTFSILAH
jgi:hypothetical protein